MNSNESAEALLHQFVLSRDEVVFREIVRQQSGMVLATATRQLRADGAAAEDVAQEVFGLLVKKADSLDGKVSVAGWLYRQTCRLGSNHLRAEGRRKVREGKAVEMMKTENEPLDEGILEELDEVMGELPEKVRDALVMRFFEGRKHQSLAAHFEITEEAARKRVARAVEMLRRALAKRGCQISSPLLLTGLTALGSEKVSAATVLQLAEQALKTPVAKAGLFSGGAMMVGALAVSVVAGGVRMAGGETGGSNLEKGERAVSSRVIRDAELPGYLRPVSPGQDEESLLLEMIALINGPQHELSELKLRLLLDEISNAEVASFIERSRERLPRIGREHCYVYLVKRWAGEDPRAALTYAMESELQKLTEYYDYHGLLPTLLRDWGEQDARAACSWLAENWTNAKLDDRSVGSMEERYGISLKFRWRKDQMARIAVTALEKSEGLAAAAKYLEGFEGEGRLRMLEALAISRSEDLVGLANLMHEQPNSEEYRWIKALFWARWDPNVRRGVIDAESVTAEEVLEEMAPGKQLEARLAMVAHGKGLPVIEGLSEKEIRKVTAEAYLAAPIYSGEGDLELSHWMIESGEGLQLDDAIRERIARWGKNKRFNSEVPTANQTILALHLSDEEEAYRLARKYFGLFLRSNPGHVTRFLKEVNLPDDLRVEFEKLQREAK